MSDDGDVRLCEGLWSLVEGLWFLVGRETYVKQREPTRAVLLNFANQNGYTNLYYAHGAY